MPNISYADCPGLSWMVSAQCTLKMCIAAWNREKFTKTPILGVQGHSRSSMLVPPENSSSVFIMVCSKSVSICNSSHATVVVKLRFLGGGYPSLMPSFEGILFTQRHQITSLETRNSVLSISWGENPVSLSDLGLYRCRVVTPGQTDRRTDGQKCHS